MDMELTYIYHSGFALSGDGFTVIMDYYRDSEDGQAQSDLNRLMDGTFSNQEAGMPEGIVHSELLRRPGKLYVLTRDILETCIDMLGFEAPEKM